MGVGPDDLLSITSLIRDGSINKNFSLCEIGAQQISNSVAKSQAVVNELSEVYGIEAHLIQEKLGTGLDAGKARGIDYLHTDAPFAKDLWELLGVSYFAIDIDTAPHSINVDLNFDDCPSNMSKKFDVIANLGTTEHVSNHSQAMKVIHDLTKVGGFMYHAVPMQGYEMHGLFNYNPKFFWMLARANNYKFCWMDVSQIPTSTQLSNDIVEMVCRSRPHRRAELEKIELKDTGLVVMMQKMEDSKYVPPIDMTQEFMAENRTLFERYFSKSASDSPGVMRKIIGKFT